MTLQDVLSKTPQRIFRPQMAHVIDIGDMVRVTSGDKAGKIGYVKLIGVSPFYTEERAGIIRGYVCPLPTAEPDIDWVAGYFLAGELELLDKGAVKVRES